MRHYLLIFLLALAVPTIAQPPTAITVPLNTSFTLYSQPDEFISGTVQNCPGSGATRELYRWTEYSFCKITFGTNCNQENSVYTGGGATEAYATTYAALGTFKIVYYKGIYNYSYYATVDDCGADFIGSNTMPPSETKVQDIMVTVENPLTFVVSGSVCQGTNKPLQEYTNKPVGATLLSFRRLDTGAGIDNINDLPAGSFTVIARYDFYGTAQEVSQSITVSASPVVAISGASSSVCSGQLPIYLADYFTVTGGATSVTYSCVSGCEAPVVIAGSGASTNLSLSAALTSTRSIVIEASAVGGGSCGSSNSRTITLNESPTTPAVPTPGAICSGSAVTLNFGTIPTGQVYEVWNAASGGSLVAGNITTSTWTSGALSANTTYYVGAKFSASGCTSSARTSVAVTIKAAAIAPTFQTVPPICTGSESRTITINAQSGHTYNWFTASSGGTAFATGNTYTKVFSATTTYYVSSDRSGCISSRQPVTVNLVNVAEISAGSDLGVCGANFADIDLNITGVTLPAPAGGSWSGLSATYLSAAGILKKGSPLLSNGVYTLTYTVNQSGCNAAATRKFTVGVTPTITITPNRTPKEYDLGEKVTFNHNYPNATSTEWDFGDSWKMTDLTGIHYYYMPGAKTVQVKITLNESGTVCEATGTFTNVLTIKETGIITGADDPSAALKEINTFPVPFVNELNIKSDLPIGNATIELLTMEGKSYIVKSKKIESGVTEIISAEEGSTIPRGMYILKVNTATQSKTIKIVKQ